FASTSNDWIELPLQRQAFCSRAGDGIDVLYVKRWAAQTMSDIARTAPSPWKTCPRIISTRSASPFSANTPRDPIASASPSKRNFRPVPVRQRPDDRGRHLKGKHQEVR